MRINWLSLLLFALAWTQSQLNPIHEPRLLSGGAMEEDWGDVEIDTKNLLVLRVPQDSVSDSEVRR